MLTLNMFNGIDSALMEKGPVDRESTWNCNITYYENDVPRVLAKISNIFCTHELP